MESLKDVTDVLHPFGDLDLLYYYSVVSEKLGNFLNGKELATKIALSGRMPKLLKRGRRLEKVYIKDLKSVDADFLRIRVGNHLGDVSGRLKKKQAVIWKYFFPRKMMDFFYACNNERPKMPIERIFIDVDKGKETDAELAQKVTVSLISAIEADEKFAELVKFRPVMMWTGNSFHIYLLLKKKIPAVFYGRYLSYNEKNSGNFAHAWANDVSRETGINVRAGHEKSEDHIVIDTSGTPSGKLARAPFSLHVKDYKTFDGIAVPVSRDEIARQGLIRNLRSLTPEKVINDLDRYEKILDGAA